MSDPTPQENLRLVKVPDKFLNHWIAETIRIAELTDTLYRALRHLEDTTAGFDPHDSTLVEDIKRSLHVLFAEIEEVQDGHWEPRSWEVSDE